MVTISRLRAGERYLTANRRAIQNLEAFEGLRSNLAGG
jgi:hypothetical protein